jgi:hypothetical protein
VAENFNRFAQPRPTAAHRGAADFGLRINERQTAFKSEIPNPPLRNPTSARGINPLNACGITAESF